MTLLEAAVSAALGISLAAAAGLRVFAPLLVASLAAHFDYLQVSPGFAWLDTVPAMTMLGVATVVEVLAYSIPAVDNLLDTIAAPAALAAGIALSAAVMVDLPPAIKWPIAVIAGGSAAGIAQGVTSLLRAKSTVLTGGLGNPMLSMLELVGALILSVLALLAPLSAIALVIVCCAITLRFLRRRRTPAPVAKT